jgi:putative N6-adenine-specific DNA methylase
LLFLPPQTNPEEPLLYSVLATTLSGLENSLADELVQLGIKDPKPAKRGVTFKCDQKQLYLVNLWSRLAVRFYKHVSDFTVERPTDIYDAAMETDWWRIIGVEDTFRIDTNVWSDLFNNPIYAAHMLKDAIADQFRSRFSRRPSVDKKSPSFNLLLAVRNEKGSIWLDSSGDSLFKRGYRQKNVRAPINEILAAGLIKLSGWTPEIPLVDPMCGSGTIPTEAALMGMNIPPQFLREHFGFMKWPDYERFIWKEIREEVMDHQLDNELQIFGSDIDPRSIEASRYNIENIRLHKDIEIKQIDFFNLKKPFENGIIIANPPYGERLHKKEINDFYTKIGDHLKQNFTGFKALIFSSNIPALKSVGLKTTRRLPLYNGPLECRLFEYDLFEGSRSEKE